MGGTRTPDYDYEFVHHVDNVTQEFIDSLQKPIEIKLFSSPYVFVPASGISTRDPGVADRVRDPNVPIAADTGAPAAVVPQVSEGNAQISSIATRDPAAVAQIEQEKAALQAQLTQSQQEAKELAARVKQLESEKGTFNGVAPGGTAGAPPSNDEATAELRRQLDDALGEVQRLRNAAPATSPANDELRQKLEQSQKELQELQKEKEEFLKQNPNASKTCTVQ